MDSNLPHAQDNPANANDGTGQDKKLSVSAAFVAKPLPGPAKRLHSQSGLYKEVNEDPDLENVPVKDDAAKSDFAVPSRKRGRPSTSRFKKTDMVHCQRPGCDCQQRRRQYRRLPRQECRDSAVMCRYDSRECPHCLETAGKYPDPDTRPN